MYIDKCIESLRQLIKFLNAQRVIMFLKKENIVLEVSIFDEKFTGREKMVYLEILGSQESEEKEIVFFSSWIGKVKRIFALKNHKYQKGDLVLEVFLALVPDESIKIVMPETGEITKFLVKENEIIDFGKPLFCYRKIKK